MWIISIKKCSKMWVKSKLFAKFLSARFHEFSMVFWRIWGKILSNFKMSPSFENHFWNQNLKIQISGKQNHEYSYGLMKRFTPYPLDSIWIYCSKALFYHHWSSISTGVIRNAWACLTLNSKMGFNTFYIIFRV